MARIKNLLLFLIAFSACRQKEFTLEYLKKAQWDSLTRGVDYISTHDEKGVAFKNNSVEFKIKGISGSEINPTEMSFNNLASEVNKTFTSILKLYLPDSKNGYLRVNFPEMIRPVMLTGMIYLRDDYNASFAFNSDSNVLKNIPGIKEVNYISKEAAKQKYIGEEDEDWDKVLDSNPFPSSIEIKLDSGEWIEASLDQLKNSILDHMGVMISDISFPTSLLKKNDEYYFFEYGRK